MTRRSVFVTGTDTAVGKTRVATGLIRHLRSAGVRAVGLKPVECGGRDDSNAILEACGEPDLSLDAVNPLWFPEPLAPAAMPDAPAIDFDRIVACFLNLQDRFETVVVEGAGGWLVPLDDRRTVADLASALGLPVVVVAANRLGVLNHSLLTIRAIESSGLECAALYLNDLGGEGDRSVKTNGPVLRRLLPGLPVVESEIVALAESL
ncbi:MAG: dethiobiotin synthase [Verrucomicrobiales bacterium]